MKKFIMHNITIAVKSSFKLAVITVLIGFGLFSLLWLGKPISFWIPFAMAETGFDEEEDEEWNLNSSKKPTDNNEELSLDGPLEIKAKKEADKQQKLRVNLQKLNALKNSKNQQESQLVFLAAQILNNDPDNLQALNTLGSFYLSKGKPQMAKIIYTRALKAHPKSSALHNNLGVVALQQQDKTEAISHFQDSLQYRRDNYIASGNLGTLYTQSYEHELSIQHLYLAYRRGSSGRLLRKQDIMRIGNNYAVALAWHEDYRKASQVFDKILQNHPQSIEPMLNYAILLAKDLKSRQQALRLLTKVDFLDHTRRYAKKVKALKKYIKSKQARGGQL